MKEINLTQGKVAQVDDEDYEFLSQYKWHANKNYQTYYAKRSDQRDGISSIISMHRDIMGRSEGMQIDHIDGNGLNNQKSNLRFVTVRQNAQNKKNINKTSKYPGVRWDKDRNKWRANIYINGKTKHLGRFESEEDAFCAYRKTVGDIGEAVV